MGYDADVHGWGESLESFWDTKTLQSVEPSWARIAERVRDNSQRVMEAFERHSLSAADLRGSGGYGYDDRGRDRLDAVYAAVFGSEAALVRPQWISGTHALSSVLHALLLPGDELWVVSGPVYDTLQALMGDPHHPASLVRRGVTVRFGNRPGVFPTAAQTPKVVYIQRSRGYQPRPSWGREEMEPLIAAAHRMNAAVVVDNCYGEFTQTEEPTHWGADLAVGSLLKNPGGGLAATGAYIAGQEELVKQVADYFIAPGQGREVGPTGEYLRQMVQGLFLAPMMVGEALAGSVYARRRFEHSGFVVEPGAQDDIWDMVSAIRLQTQNRVERFCAAIQRTSPIDADARPQAWEMPGYPDPVIMAQGGFVPGGSLELSCDAPMRPPYWIYLQGGLNRWQTIRAAERALKAVLEPL